MNRKRKKVTKAIIALALSVIMLITSIPFVMAEAADNIDPTPKFSEEDIKQGVMAWYNERGGISIRFPSAEPGKELPGDSKPRPIAYYYLELVDLGSVDDAIKKAKDPNTSPDEKLHTEEVVHKKLIKAEQIATVSEGKLNGAGFTAAELATIHGGSGLDRNHRYSVSVTAIDTGNWFSLELHTIVGETPGFVYDESAYSPLSSHEYAIREMIRFESDADSSFDATVTGGLRNGGRTEQTGVDNTRGNRIIIEDLPGQAGASFYTGDSRQHWDFRGAEEVWFWMDLSQIEVKGLSFELYANKKIYNAWTDRSFTEKNPDTGEYYWEHGNQASIPYSTKGTAMPGYKGEAPYVYVQGADGAWDKTMLNADGTIDLANYKGYIRIPLEFMCSTKTTTVTASNADLINEPIADNKVNQTEAAKRITAKMLLPGNTVTVNDDKNKGDVSVNATKNYIVDKAGTPISEALLIQTAKIRHKYNYTNIIISKFVTTQYHLGDVLAFGINPDNLKSNDTNHGDRRAVTADGLTSDGMTLDITNREKAFKALEDMAGAGFSYKGIGENDIYKNIYMDNVMFYRTEGQYVFDTKIEGTGYGNPIKDYYEQEKTIENAIFSAIDEYIGTPDFMDYTAVKYIRDMINGYKTAYEKGGANIDFLEDTALSEKNPASWNRLVKAEQECMKEGTMGKDGNGNAVIMSNNTSAQLTPQLARLLEKFPDPDVMGSLSDEFNEPITLMYNLYTHLNQQQLQALGRAEEEKLLKYFDLADDSLLSRNVDVVGRRLGDMGWYLFSDFEKNKHNDLQLGDRGLLLENTGVDSDGAPLMNWNNRNTPNVTNGFSTFTADWGWLTQMNRIYDRPAGLKYNAANAIISDEGLNGSLAARITFDSNFEGGATTDDALYGWAHTLNVSRDTQQVESYDKFREHQTKELETFASKRDNGKDWPRPDNALDRVALVFYADFTDMSQQDNFTVTTQLYVNGEGEDPWFGDDFTEEQDVKSVRLNFENNSTFYTLNDKGNWVERTTSNQWSLTGLAGYRGYVKIPLEVFRYQSNEDYLLSWRKDLQRVASVQFCFGGKELEGKSVVIDNIGFAYGIEAYEDKGITVPTKKTYAEIMNMKNQQAVEFEGLVEVIDVYDEFNNFKAQVAKALDYYNNVLPEHQYPHVQAAIAKLEVYESYIDNPGEKPLPATMSVEEIKKAIDLLPKCLKNATTDGTQDLDFPGFDEKGNVDYMRFHNDVNCDCSITEATAMKEKMTEVIDLYEKQYQHLSKSDKGKLDEGGNGEVLKNAYSAAKRCVGTLEGIKEQVTEYRNSFWDKETGMYRLVQTHYDDNGLDWENETTPDLDNYAFMAKVEKENRKGIVELYDKFNSLDHYAQKAVNGGLVYKDLTNTAEAINLLLSNTQTVTAPIKTGDTTEDKTINGGVLTLLDEWTELKESIKSKMDNLELLSEDDYADIDNAVAVYNSLRNVYKSVTELHTVIEDIKNLFPKSVVGFANGTVSSPSNKTDILINNKAESYKTALYVGYLVDYEKDATPSTFFTVEYTGKITETDDSGVSTEYQVYWDNNSNPIKTTNTSSTPPSEDKIQGVKVFTELKNNEYGTNKDGRPKLRIIPIEVKIPETVSLQDAVGEIIIREYRAARGVAEKPGSSKLVREYTIDIKYSLTDTYCVHVPAEGFRVDWQDLEKEKEVNYTVDTSLYDNSSISVSVAAVNDGKMTGSPGNDKTLIYEAVGDSFKAQTYTGINTGEMPYTSPTIRFTNSKQVPIDSYKGQLTYTVEYTDGSTL